MVRDPDQTNGFDRVASALRHAPAPTARLIQSLIATACTRLPNLSKASSERIARLIATEAWTDAALAVIESELPQWSLRRLVCDDGEWLCALSRQPHIPESLDDTADGHHAVASLAILDAFLEARRRTIGARETQARTVPSVRAIPEHAICCDNFS